MLHLTKVAFGCSGVDDLAERLAQHAGEGALRLTTRYLPKRHEEIAGQGSLFWIWKHQLVGRSPIQRFEDAENGRVSIVLEPRLILVKPQRKRAHQMWRYLEAQAAPADLLDGDGAEGLPPTLASELAALGLI